ncbi:hypothetical protein [Desulfuromonas sp. TF]|uniref:hypothetical protein n=1 Tax=Desulfuromonas sp. TF TaxID=1232410 RepID=UPI0004888852|nr:hypothetical protein [Desulfuromonas sp. TF]
MIGGTAFGSAAFGATGGDTRTKASVSVATEDAGAILTAHHVPDIAADTDATTADAIGTVSAFHVQHVAAVEVSTEDAAASAGITHFWDVRPGQIIYRLTLTGAPDVELPLLNFQARARAEGQTYLSCTIPYTAEIADAIAERGSGDLVLRTGLRYADGQEQLEVLLQVELDALPDQDVGTKKASITLVGHSAAASGAVATRPPQTREVAGINYRRLGSPRQLRTPVVDFWLRPGDTAVDPASGLSITANLITYIVGSAPSMTVSEGAI